jgi:hypothetical protein
MKQLFKTLLYTIPLLAIAVGVGAYSNPPAFPTDTTVVPVTTGTADQSKTGGLGVTTFIARDDAVFAKTMYVSGIIRGGSVCGTGCPDSTVNVGDSSSTVELAVSNVVDAANPDARYGTLTTEALKGSGTRKTCSDGGKVVLCQ